jgi:hypothetical protein
LHSRSIKKSSIWLWSSRVTKPYKRSTWSSVVVQASDPSTKEAAAGGLGVPGQPGLMVRHCLKK